MLGWMVVGLCALGVARSYLWIAAACFALGMFERHVSGARKAGVFSWLRFRYLVGVPLLAPFLIPPVLLVAVRSPRSVGGFIRALLTHYRMHFDSPLSGEELEARKKLSPEVKWNLWRVEGQFGKRLEASKLGTLFEVWSKPETAEEKASRERLDKRDAEVKARNEKIAALNATLPANSPTAPGAVNFRLSEQVTISVAYEGSVTLPAGEYQGVLAVGALTDEEAEENDYASLPCTFEFRHAGSGYRIETWMNCQDLYPTEAMAGSAPQFWWSDASAEWREQLRKGLLVARQKVMNDERLREPFPQAGPEYCLFSKYLSWTVDLGVSADGQRLHARVCDLFAEKYKQEVGPAFRNGAELDFEDMVVQPPICLEAPIEDIVPLTNPDRHGLRGEGGGEELVYRRVEEEARK